MNAIAFGENEFFHLGVPAFGLVTKMHPGFQQFCDCYVGQCILHCFIQSRPQTSRADRTSRLLGLDFGSMLLCPDRSERFSLRTTSRGRGQAFYATNARLQAQNRAYFFTASTTPPARRATGNAIANGHSSFIQSPNSDLSINGLLTVVLSCLPNGLVMVVLFLSV